MCERPFRSEKSFRKRVFRFAFSLCKSVFEFGRLLPRETTQAKAKNRLPSEKVALIERKGVLRAKTCLTQAKTPTNVARKVEKASTERSRYFYRTFSERKRNSERRKCLYRAKTSLAKAITFLPSLNFARKGENPSIERKHHNRAKTSLAKTKMCLLSDISARKTRFRICGRRFRSIKSFSHLGVTFWHV